MFTMLPVTEQFIIKDLGSVLNGTRRLSGTRNLYANDTASRIPGE